MHQATYVAGWVSLLSIFSNQKHLFTTAKSSSIFPCFFEFLPLPFEALTKQERPNVCWDSEKMRYLLKLPPYILL